MFYKIIIFSIALIKLPGKKSYFFFYLNLCFIFSLLSQDVHFSQFSMAPLWLNPAQAGAQHDMRGTANYKSQWGSVAQPYSTANLSWDMRLGKSDKKVLTGIGININQDQSGSPKIKTFQAALSYACHIKVSEKSRLGIGLYGAVIQRSISYEGLQWMNQYDGLAYNPSLSSKEIKGAMIFFRPDAGAGIHYEYSKNEKFMTGNDHRKLSAGVSAFHINKPAYSFYGSNEKLYMKFGGYVNAEIGLPNSDLSLVPGFYYFQQGPSTELLIGTLMQYKLTGDSKYTGYIQGSTLSFGAYYRVRDAAIANVLFKFSHYSIGLSYDFNVSNLKTASKGGGGFEIALRYVNPNTFMHKPKERL